MFPVETLLDEDGEAYGRGGESDASAQTIARDVGPVLYLRYGHELATAISEISVD